MIASQSWQDYFILCKPKVIFLMLITAWVGMLMAMPSVPQWSAIIFGTIGIALSASAGAVLNHLAERHIDTHMLRTRTRPVASGRISTKQAGLFALSLAVIGLGILFWKVNALTAVLTSLALIGYAGFYTIFLKHATPQNIVIGGLAGAAPPLLGWTAITGHVDPNSLLLVLIIFVWTPPHFWALALYRRKEYAQAKLPMLPVTHGVAFTKLCIVLYTLLLIPTTLLPYLTGMSGLIYAVGVSILNLVFLYYALYLWRTPNERFALKTFGFSIIYLFALFLLLLLDHYQFWYLL